MLYFLSLIYLLKSDPTQKSTYMYSLQIKINSTEVVNDQLLEFLFYRFSNDNNGPSFELVCSSNISIAELFSKEDFLFVVGKVKIVNFVFAGIYKKKTSDFLLVYNLTTYLSQQTFDHIGNFSNPANINNNLEILTLISNLRSLSEDLNNTKKDVNITVQDFQELKQTYLNENYPLQYVNNSNKSMIKIDSFIYFIETKGMKAKDVLFLKLNHVNSLNNSINGFLKPPLQLFTFKITQINVLELIQKFSTMAKYLLILSFIIIPLLKNIDSKINYRWNLQYFYAISYDMMFSFLMKQIVDYIEYVGISNKTYYALNALYKFRHVVLYNSIEKLLDEIIDNKWINDIPYCIPAIFIINYSFCFIRKFLETNGFDILKLLIFQASTNLIPQIITNIYNYNIYYSMDMSLIFLSYLRLFEIRYYFIYMKNNEENSFKKAFILISLQSLILLFQNRSHIKQLIMQIYDDKAPLNDEICPICFSEMDQSSGDCIVTNCNHMFHKDCLKRWMREKMICPICRESLPIVHTFSHLL